MNEQASKIADFREQLDKLPNDERFPVLLARFLFTEPRTKRQMQTLLRKGYRGRNLQTWDEAGRVYTTKAAFYRFRDGGEQE